MSDRYEENDSGQDVGDSSPWFSLVVMSVFALVVFLVVWTYR